MCGGCHSRRAPVGTVTPGEVYGDQYRLSLLDDGLYHADGQIDAEVFVLGSFLQSRMYAAGVTCTNCHEPHSGKLVQQGNRLCAQCHRPDVFDTTSHHLHQAGTDGSQCVACHMPATTYMLVDDRRDHRFGIPDPTLTRESGVPNACQDCHSTRTLDWMIQALDQPPGQTIDRGDAYARLNSRVRRGDSLALPDAINFARDPSNPAIKRATILSGLANMSSAQDTRMAVELLDELLDSPEPLLRVAAVQSFGAVALSVRPEARAALLKKFAADPVKAVRVEAGRVAAGVMRSRAPEDSQAVHLAGLISEYRASLMLSLDTAATQTELGLLELNLGRTRQAFSAYQRAIKIEPAYLPALLNLADWHRAGGEEGKAIELLQEAVKVAPESGAANYSYGLSLIRQNKKAEALGYLQKASQGEDSQPGYAYVYAVALDAASRTSEAVTALRVADARWPNQFDILLLQVLYLDRLGRTKEIAAPLRLLVEIAPMRPEVRALVRRYEVAE